MVLDFKSRTAAESVFEHTNHGRAYSKCQIIRQFVTKWRHLLPFCEKASLLVGKDSCLSTDMAFAMLRNDKLEGST